MADRFAFGANWTSYLATVDGERITAAQQSLIDYLGHDLSGVRFLDVGSGSGLFSLAARNLGADVVSFDYDPGSVACTEEIRNRYRPHDKGWTVLQGDVLDRDFLAALGHFDVVYAWGSLHHTGALYESMANAASLVAPHGRLYLSVYNHQGPVTAAWRWVKRTYNSGWMGRAIVLVAFAPRILAGRVRRVFAPPTSPRYRAMSRWHDTLDWLGGYPFEAARPDDVLSFLGERGFRSERVKTVGRKPLCNEFVLSR